MKALRAFLLLTLAMLLVTIPTSLTRAAGPSVSYLGFAGGGCGTGGAGFSFAYTYTNVSAGSYISFDINAPNNAPFSASPTDTMPTGSGTTASGYGTPFANLLPSTPFDMQWTAQFHNPDSSVFGSIPFILHCDPVHNTLTISIGGSSGPEPALFMDGRQNKNEAGQTAAVYCNIPDKGDVRVYALYNEVGYLAFTVTKAQLAAGNQNPASPYLIKAGKGAELWRLQDGSLRIKRGTYVFDWPGC